MFICPGADISSFVRRHEFRLKFVSGPKNIATMRKIRNLYKIIEMDPCFGF